MQIRMEIFANVTLQHLGFPSRQFGWERRGGTGLRLRVTEAGVGGRGRGTSIFFCTGLPFSITSVN